MNNVYIGPEVKKAKLATGSGYAAEDKVEEVPGRFIICENYVTWHTYVLKFSSAKICKPN